MVEIARDPSLPRSSQSRRRRCWINRRYHTRIEGVCRSLPTVESLIVPKHTASSTQPCYRREPHFWRVGCSDRRGLCSSPPMVADTRGNDAPAACGCGGGTWPNTTHPQDFEEGCR